VGKPRKRIRGKPPKARSCDGKQQFETEAAAEAAAYRPHRMLRTGSFMKAYKCRFCSKWHYGHPVNNN
jgi:hypothetical protein